jgi:hypothetical protein
MLLIGFGVVERRTGAFQQASPADRGHIAENAVTDTQEPGTRWPVSRKAIPHRAGYCRICDTPLGRTLSATVDSLRIWAETHIDKVLKAQKQYDAGLQRKAA